MKKILLVLLTAALCFSLTACFDETDSMLLGSNSGGKDEKPADEPTGEPEPAVEPTQTPEPAQEATPEPTQAPEPTQTPEPTEQLPWLPEPPETPGLPEGASQDAIAFMDGAIDIFIVVDIPGWTYTTEMYAGEVFFYPEGDISGSTGLAISSNFKDENTIDDIWQDIYSTFEVLFTNFEWEKNAAVSAGKYEAQRYSFSAEDFKGDYFFWYSQERLYICSFTALESEYDDLLPKVLSSLETFVAVSELRD